MERPTESAGGDMKPEMFNGTIFFITMFENSANSYRVRAEFQKDGGERQEITMTITECKSQPTEAQITRIIQEIA